MSRTQARWAGDLGSFRDQVNTLPRAVEDLLALLRSALGGKAAELAPALVHGEEGLRRSSLKIEERGVTLLQRWQPGPQDIRHVMAVGRLVDPSRTRPSFSLGAPT